MIKSEERKRRHILVISILIWEFYSSPLCSYRIQHCFPSILCADVNHFPEHSLINTSWSLSSAHLPMRHLEITNDVEMLILNICHSLQYNIAFILPVTAFKMLHLTLNLLLQAWRSLFCMTRLQTLLSGVFIMYALYSISASSHSHINDGNQHKWSDLEPFINYLLR